MVEYAIAQSLGYRVIGTGNASEEALSKIEKRHKESEHKRNAPPAFLD